jgi:hypothetical protein
MSETTELSALPGRGLITIVYAKGTWTAWTGRGEQRIALAQGDSLTQVLMRLTGQEQ